jgi:copper chaperone CopZ
MKIQRIVMLVALLTAVVITRAQVTHVSFQASGLTCAMCNNAINKAVQKLDFVEKIKSDIKNASFDVTLKDGRQADPDAIKKAVEDAGFSVAKMILTVKFDHVTVPADKHVIVNGQAYYFLTTPAGELNGEVALQLMDKNFISTKQFKKVSASEMPCMQSGKAEACCVKDGMTTGQRIYHVSI